MRKIIALSTFAALLGTALPAQAGVAPAVRQKIVRFHDLDLSKTADRKKLEFRVRHAARTVCNIVDIRNVAKTSQEADCYERAIGGARQQLAARGVDVQLASR